MRFSANTREEEEWMITTLIWSCTTFNRSSSSTMLAWQSLPTPALSTPSFLAIMSTVVKKFDRLPFATRWLADATLKV